MKSIKIVSDGTPQGTFVLSPSGEKLPGITRIAIGEINSDTLVQATITFTYVSLDLIAEMVAK